MELYRDRRDYDKEIKIEGNHISYISRKQFKKYYPKGKGYSLLGTIGNIKGQDIGTWIYEEEEHNYQDMNYSSFHYGIDGFIEVGDDTFLAVLKDRRWKHMLMILCSLLLLSGIGLGIYNYLQKDGPEIDRGAGVFKANLKMKKNQDPDHILIPGYGDIKMVAGTDTAYVSLWNPEGNPCYFKFIITTDDTNKSIFESKLIPPGYAVENVKLTRKIEKGIHPITIHIQTYELDDYDKAMNSGEIQTNLVGIEK